jgi:signal transduction histidine kinase
LRQEPIPRILRGLWPDTIVTRTIAVLLSGLVVFTSRASGPTRSVTVTDHGPGIPAEEREAMFTPFFRGAPHRDTKVGGGGLRSTIARTIVRAHGGELALLDAACGSKCACQAHFSFPGLPLGPP